MITKKLEQKCIPQIEDIQKENSVGIEFSSHIYISRQETPLNLQLCLR